MTERVHQDKSGLKRLLSLPAVYNLLQFAAGAKLYRTRMVRDFIKPFPGCRILDIGCGTGEYVDIIDRFCTDYTYCGFDSEAAYIDAARTRYASRPALQFSAQILTEDMMQDLGAFDIVLAMGVMHHMDDGLVNALLRLAKSALKPDGRFITYDPGAFEDMNAIERFFVKHDRGRNIRPPAQYDQLVGAVFTQRSMSAPYLTYYPCRNVVFTCQH